MSVKWMFMSLVLLINKTGCRADVSVFVQTGKSLQMDLPTDQIPTQYLNLDWKSNESKNIVNFNKRFNAVTPEPFYEHRVNFNITTFSLTLKNLQKNDTGTYTARTSGLGTDKEIIIYRVSVIDAVVSPVLTVNSNWSSSDSCVINFTCRGYDLTINSSYQHSRCSPEEVTSQDSRIFLLCSDESIICNYSNPVSWRQERIEVKPVCVNNEYQAHQSDTNIYWVIVVVVVVVVVVVILAAVLKKLRKTEDVYQKKTVYDTVKPQHTGSNAPHTYDEVALQGPREAKPSESKVCTTYSTVGQHTAPLDSPPPDNTIYAQVYKEPKPSKRPEEHVAD